MATKPKPKKNPDPKKAPGALKVQLHLVPPCAVRAEAIALEQGAEKYGPFNWRESDSVRASTYYSAALRHLAAWWDGENDVPDNIRAHHLGAARASLAILLDSMAAGTFTDDRPKPITRKD